MRDWRLASVWLLAEISRGGGTTTKIGTEKRRLRIVAECLHGSACNRRSVHRTLKRASPCETPLSFSLDCRSGHSERALKTTRQR